jgi:dienelactone hydrolase
MPADSSFLTFIRDSADSLRSADRAPTSLDEWNGWRARLKQKLEAAWGGFPKEAAALEPRVVGELQGDGYRIEKVLFQTWPGVVMPANVYLPDRPGKLPAVLNVHGHWKGAKQDEHVQARCIGLAKLGFVALAVDAFGAGERGVGTNLGEYHGEMTAATLWPVGRPLSGLQVYENVRAVDYLLTRPEVNANALGITGASGGGNQTMYAGAWDDRFKAVVPVCSVGNYRAYLGAACCMCEVVPGALEFTEEWAILALVAPRALMVVNATRDARQFSVEEAKKSLALAQSVFELAGKPKHVRHAVFESPHDYSQAMREAMYGWMTLHLKGEGDGSPIAEGKTSTLAPEELRCYPNASRPADYATIPLFAAQTARKVLGAKPTPDHLDFWKSEAFTMREGLEKVLGDEPEPCPLALTITEADAGRRKLEFDSEPGVRLQALHVPGESKRWVIVVDHKTAEEAAAGEVARALAAGGWNVVCPQLRACGSHAPQGDTVGHAPDHNSAEWSLWLGRPLLGQWSLDVRRTVVATLASIESMPETIAVVGVGTGGLVALLAAAQDEVIDAVAMHQSLATYVTEVPFRGQRLGLMAPGILLRAGDVPHLAALIAPRPLLVTEPTKGANESLGEPSEHFAYTQAMFKLQRASEKLAVQQKMTPAELAAKLTELV